MIANPNDGNSPRVEVATPMIDVSAGGLITAKTEQEKGYVPGGTKSATQQLTTQGAATITPGTTAQTAVASGRYTTGDVQVAGDANLVPENIAEGVSIFGVQGTHSGGGIEFKTVSTVTSSGGKYSTYSVTISMENKQNIVCYLDTNEDTYLAASLNSDRNFHTNIGDTGLFVEVSENAATMSGTWGVSFGAALNITYCVF